MSQSPHSRCPTCHRKIKRSNEANRMYWSLLHMMASKLRPGGQVYSAETFHKYYASRFLGCDDVALPNGTVYTIPRSTADLDTAEFADYLDKVQADAAERGIYLADMEAA